MTEPIMAPKNRPFRTRNILFVVGAVVLLCCCAGVILVGKLLWSAKDEIPAAGTATSQYLADIKARRMDAAYDRLCPATQARVSRSSFPSMMAPLSSYEIVGVNVTNVNGRERAVVSTKLTFTDGSVLNQAFGLAKLNGEWTICDE
jgi:hypothetical protein